MTFVESASASGSITINNDSKSLDSSNFTDLVSATAHEFNHVLSSYANFGINGFVGLAPKDTSPKNIAYFEAESAAFAAQVNAEKVMVNKGEKPVSPDTTLGRANKAFQEAKTDTEKYELLTGYGYKFQEKKPGAQPANRPPSKTKNKL